MLERTLPRTKSLSRFIRYDQSNNIINVRKGVRAYLLNSPHGDRGVSGIRSQMRFTDYFPKSLFPVYLNVDVSYILKSSIRTSGSLGSLPESNISQCYTITLQGYQQCYSMKYIYQSISITYSPSSIRPFL